MPPPQRKPEESFLLDMRTTSTIVFYVVGILAMCIKPFTRTRFGRRGIGSYGFWAMIAIALYAGTTQSEEMLQYWYAWLGMVIYRRITADRRQHTEFQGFVWAFDWLIKNELHARRLEAVSLLLLGHALSGWSEAVGNFLFYGGCALVAQCIVDAMIAVRRKDAAHDARVEMEAASQQLESVRRGY